MSGICGWIGDARTHGDSGSILAAMSRSLEGTDVTPNDHGTVAAGLAARMSLVPVSTYRSGALSVAIEGHVRWSSPDAATLAAQRGSAAAVAELYLVHGASCLQHIRAAFALAVVDSAARRGLIAVDRMGIRTMCYATPPGQLVFGSTTGSVTAHPAVGSGVSEQAMFNYLYCHMVPSPGTIFRSVKKLQPGECVVFEDGAVRQRFYWQLQYHERGKEPLGALEIRFGELLRMAAKRAIDGSNDVGAFLSGGTDSSTVAGLLTELRGSPADTYSIGFAAEGFDEMDYARITSRHFRTRAHEYYVTPQDVVEAIPIVTGAYDEPFGNASAVPTYFCARMARADGVRVMLAGDGGDEIFGGNARYAKQKIFGAYWLLPAAMRRALIEPVVLRFPGGDRVPVLNKARSYVRQASIPLPDRLESYNFLHRSPLSEIFEPNFLASIDPDEPLRLLRDAYNRAAATSAVDRMMHLDLKVTLADNDLRKVSRMCAVAGIETRFPLIDEDLVEFSGELPGSLKVRGFRLRYFFKHALRNFLPAETIAKTKHGFGMPFGVWMKEYAPLTAMARDSLDAFQRRGIVRPAYVQSLLQQHQTTHSTYFGVMIWVMMMLERWLDARKL
jgi:asparagine synthase (glutamine-hydrolysing)